MRTVIACICLLLAVAALPSAAQTPANAQQGSQKVIHDPVEYNAYMTALNTPDPAQKAAAMEAFVANYPDSVVLEDALEQAMAAYQAAGRQAEVEKVAKRILHLNEDNVRALAILVALTRAALTNGRTDVKAAELRVLSERGLKLVPEWQKAADLSEIDFARLQTQAKLIFYGAAGFGALLEKDYTAAREYYPRALAIDPEDLPNTYQLSIADLEMPDPDVKGFWYVARAIHLCEKQRNETCARMITNYALAKYRKFHGSEEGWEQILSRAATGTEPPRDFSVVRTAPPSAGSDGASLASSSSSGNAHNTSASILSSDRASAGVLLPNGTPASVLSANSAGNGHSVPASVLSVNSPGTGHNVQASVTSSTPRAQGPSSGIAASILRTASASASAVGRGLTALSKSLSSQRVK